MDEPLWLSRSAIETLHLDQAREHGGQLGLRDSGLLEPMLARPHHVWTYEADADLATLAAEYGFGLADKRVAFVAANVFLILNGFETEAAETEVVDAMLRVADGRMDRARFAQWIRSVMIPFPA